MGTINMDVDCMTEDCTNNKEGECDMPFIEIVGAQCGSYESKGG